MNKELKVLEKYYVTTCGRIFSSLKSKKNLRWIEVKTKQDRDGYLRATLIYDENGNRQPFGVHRLVARKFIGEFMQDGLVVNHIDCIKSNNYVRNLEWVSVQYNTQHGYENYCYKTIKPIKIMNALTGEEELFPHASAGFRAHGISIGNIRHVMRNGKYLKKPHLKFEYVKECNDYPVKE